MSLFWTSLFTWSDEALTFLFFVWGVLWGLKWLIARRRVILPAVTDKGLMRFAIWQVVFLASWSVLFKDLLPDFVRQPTGPLYHGWSRTFAITAEDIGFVFAMCGIWAFLTRTREGRS